MGALGYSIGKWYDQKQRTYRQRHGHDHVSTIHSWNIQDAGTCVWIYPLNRTGRFAHASRCSTQRWCESPNRVSHQHGRVGLYCNERKWIICKRKCLNGRTFDDFQFPPTRCFARMQLLGFKSLKPLKNASVHTDVGYFCISMFCSFMMNMNQDCSGLHEGSTVFNIRLIN